MNRFVAGFLLGLAPLCLAQTRLPAVLSPEVHPDRTVTFRLQAPKATEVQLAGDLVSTPRALAKDAEGVWSLTLGPLRSDLYTYRFSVDGVSAIDPENPARPPTMFSVPGDAPAIYDLRPVAHGELREHWYESKSLGTIRHLFVYAPPGYERMTTRLPALYLLHGAAGDESTLTESGRVRLILDNLIADGKLKPLIVAMPYGFAYPPGSRLASEPDATKRQRRGFARDLIEDVVPYVEASYRTCADRDHRAIVGTSLGGAQALAIGLRHPELFSRVGGLSPALGAVTSPDAGGVDFLALLADSGKVNQEYKLIWIGCGTEDTLFESIQGLERTLRSNGVKHVWRESRGAHSFLTWRRYLAEVLPMLFSGS